MKKKLFITITALAAAAAVLAVPAAAHGGHGRMDGSCREAVCCYLDEDGDGTCDNCGDACGYRHFIDEDGNGLCDRCGKAPVRQGGCHGRGHHGGRRCRG